ncbi:MAG: hypothetical protein P4L49_07525 [Desulfosporosinus sp.]|nr:hypothetical protein [Desulfosporosinus sp.]
MRFKAKPVVFIGLVFIVFVFSLTGLAGCGQTQQTMASVGPDGIGPAPLNEEKSALRSVQMVDAKNRGDLAFTQQGLLYLLYGETGKQIKLTNSGKAYYPAWSFDGQWIAFIFSSGQDENNGQLWLVHRDGQQAHQVQDLPELPNVPNISWSPTANVLVAEGRDGIWVVPAEGKPYQIPGIGKYSGYACWSPDGKALACNSGPTPTQDSNNPQDRQDILYTYNLENGRTTQQLKAPGQSQGSCGN